MKHMPPPNEPTKESKGPGVRPAAAAVAGGPYPPEALDFVHRGLEHTVCKIHGPEQQAAVKTAKALLRGLTEAAQARKAGPRPSPKPSRHVSGQQLCEGLREFALEQWGRLAGLVLKRWNITSTLDFGRVVFWLIEVGQMQKNEEDSLEDFRNVYDFKAAFETGYRIPAKTA